MTSATSLNRGKIAYMSCQPNKTTSGGGVIYMVLQTFVQRVTCPTHDTLG
jgi:hypothetical protein